MGDRLTDEQVQDLIEHSKRDDAGPTRAEAIIQAAERLKAMIEASNG